MIVVGVDPGARWTGIVLVDDCRPDRYGKPHLIGSVTVTNPDPDKIGGAGEVIVPRSYLSAVCGSIVDAIRDDRAPTRAGLIAVEGIRRPSWHKAGKVKPVDPSAIMATGIVLGAILGRHWTPPLVVVRPESNGRSFPLDAYPEPLATSGKGNDKRRHERSAYDVAAAGPLAHRLERALEKGSRP